MIFVLSKNTKSERFVFSQLRKRSIYFQKHYKKALGSPDIALSSKKIAVFIDGDFWHGRNFQKDKNRLPKKYWEKKIETNIARDRRNKAKLQRHGWRVLRVWGSGIIKTNKKIINKIVDFINQNG